MRTPFFLCACLLATVLKSHASSPQSPWEYPLGDKPFEFKIGNQGHRIIYDGKMATIAYKEHKSYPLHVAQTPKIKDAEQAGVHTGNQHGVHGQASYGVTYPNGFAFIQPDFINDILDKVAQNLKDGINEPVCALEIGAAKGYHTQMFLAAFDRRFGPDPLLVGRDFRKQKLVHYVINEFAPNMHPFLHDRFAEHPTEHPVKFMISTKSFFEHFEKTSMKYDAISSFMVFHFLAPVEYVKALFGVHEHLKALGKFYGTQNPATDTVQDLYLMKKLEKRKAQGDLFPHHMLDQELIIQDIFKMVESVKCHFPDFSWQKAVDTLLFIWTNEFNAPEAESLFNRCNLNVEKAIMCKQSKLQYMGIVAQKGHTISDEQKISLLAQAEKEETWSKNQRIELALRLKLRQPTQDDFSPEFKEFWAVEKELQKIIDFYLMNIKNYFLN